MSSPANANARQADNVYARYPSLEDRTVLITGGATGIGASFVEHFAAQGSRVAFFDIDASAGEALADELGDSRHKPLFLPCDLTDIDALRKAIADVKGALGPIEVLVNNAANWISRHFASFRSVSSRLSLYRCRRMRRLQPLRWSARHSGYTELDSLRGYGVAECRGRRHTNRLVSLLTCHKCESPGQVNLLAGN